MRRLEGRAAIVTGAARGIGEATARRFVEEGAQVMLTDILVPEGRAAAQVLGESARFMEHDVRDEAQWKSVVDACRKEFGSVDILVNNAGFGGVHFELLETIPLETIRQMIDINLIGTILGMQSVIPAMTEAGSGSIINISSSVALSTANALSVYSATKWAVRGITKSAALELGPKGIRVNSIHPGGADTLMGNYMGLPHEEFSKGFTHAPLQRACNPSEIASGILFFASDDSRYCTGAELVVDGGQAAGVYLRGLPGHPRTSIKRI